CSLFYNVALVF
nr:immunoglobulin light chain junction region [Macaca mulatta]